MTFDELVDAYYEQTRGLVDGGADILMPETTFDTLNLKAALFAIEKYFADTGIRLPIIASITITDASGRTLSGQTVEACWNSISHAPLLAVGINCALGAKEMRPHIEELAAIAPVYLSCYPNAGLPNALGEYDQTPDEMAALLHEYAGNNWINIVGGCCGTTPDYIRAIAEAVKSFPPRDAAGRSRSTCGSADWKRSPSRRSRTSSWSASAPTSPARRSSRSSSKRAISSRRWPSPNSRSTAARTSSTSTWTKGCSTPRR